MTTTLDRLGPVAQVRAGRLGRRLPQLLVGLAAYGVSAAMMLRAHVGAMPWDVLHQGIARHLPWDFGAIVIAVSVLVLALWVPIRELPGLGTVLNAVLVGLFADLGLAVLSDPGTWWGRAALAAGGIVLNAAATACYVGAQLGPGPRDGLMTGLHRRTGLSLRLVRTSIEVTVVVAGWLLGGTFGVATVAYALVIGPLVQLLLPRFLVSLPAGSPARRPVRPRPPRRGSSR
nr:hypothetical protein [Marmoricola endophyticus]